MSLVPDHAWAAVGAEPPHKRMKMDDEDVFIPGPFQKESVLEKLGAKKPSSLASKSTAVLSVASGSQYGDTEDTGDNTSTAVTLQLPENELEMGLSAHLDDAAPHEGAETQDLPPGQVDRQAVPSETRPGVPHVSENSKENKDEDNKDEVIPKQLDPFTLAKAVVENGAKNLFENWVGMELTEANLEVFNEQLKETYGDVEKGMKGDEEATEKPEMRSDLNLHDERRFVAIMKFLNTGEWDSRSGLANRMRKMHPELQLNNLTPQEVKEHQLKFCNMELQPLVVVKEQRKSWSKVDLTTARYRTFDRIVQDLGGGQAALKGASIGCAKCLCMGRPWWPVHPQPEMVEFVITEGAGRKLSLRVGRSAKRRRLTARTSPRSPPP